MYLLCVIIKTNIKQYIHKMQVNNEILDMWLKNLDHGDHGKIKAETGLSHPTIANALKGEASKETIIKINDFFKRKVAALNKEIKA